MTVEVKIELEGFERLQNKLKDERFVKGPLKDFFAKAAFSLEKSAKEFAPVDTGRLRASISTKLEDVRATVGTPVGYACVVGSRHQVYEPVSRTASNIGNYPHSVVLAKDGQPHEISAKHRFHRNPIEAMSIMTRPGRKPLIVTIDHLILIWRDGQVIWERADALRDSDKVFGKRSHNAIVDSSNKQSVLCFCGTIFEVNRYELVWRTPKYCSAECRHKYGSHSMNAGMHWQLTEEQRKAKTGPNNSQWRGGSSTKGYDFAFNGQLKFQVQERDGFQCQNCDSPFDLVVHHLDWDKMNSTIDNLITLCRRCHGKLHAQDCELAEVNQIVFTPKPILRLDEVLYTRRNRENLPLLYDFTVDRENSFVVGGVLVHNSYVEFGTRPHFPPPNALRLWARRHGFPNAFLVARAIARRGTRASRFMQRSLEANVGTIQRLLSQLAADVDKEWGRG